MRQWLTLLLLVLILGLVAGSSLGVDSGYVLVSWLNYTVETTFAFFLVLMVLTTLVLYVALRVALVLLGSDWGFNEWRARKRNLRARQQTTKGLMCLAQGQWKRAESLLSRSAKDADTPMINYLAAARAAQEQGKIEAADDWVRAAQASTKGADLTVGIIQAELLVGRGQKEQALAVLLKLRQENPKNALLLKRLTDLYLSLQDWKALHDLIPTIRKFARIPDDKLQELEERVLLQMLERTPYLPQANGSTLAALQKTYNDSARPLRYSLPIAKRYIELLVELKAEALAEQELRSILNNLWHDDLVCLYGQVQGEDAGRQLLFAEKQLPERPNDAVLLLALGRLALRVGDSDKALEYWATALRFRNLPALHTEMGKVLCAQGQTEQACEHFQLALSE